MKVCGTCQKRKRDSSFYVDPRRPGETRSYCKGCARKQRDSWYRANRARRAATSNAYRRRNPERHLLMRARARALAGGLPFDLELADIVIPSVCPLLGMELRTEPGPLVPHAPTLDRIRPELGYVRGNVWVVSARANLIKQDATWQELDTVARELRRRVDGALTPPARP